MSRRPAFVTETDEPPPWTDCSWAALSMLIDKTCGERYDKDYLRRLSGDQVGGSNHNDLMRTCEKLQVPVRRLDHPWERFVNELVRGCGASVSGNMYNVPPHLKRWDKSFGASKYAWHEVYVQDADRGHNRVWWMDPLGRGNYDGEWVTLDTLWSFVKPLATSFGYVPALYSPRPTPAVHRTGEKMIALVVGDVKTESVYRLRRGTEVHRVPDARPATKVNTLTKETVVPALGNVDGSSVWRAAIFTSANYPDHQPRKTVYYVRGVDVLAVEDSKDGTT